ncbi:MAG: hypothetical protein IPG06_05935 [Haliea sp.]|nr:hypothetical protein [Haliea sp.]
MSRATRCRNTWQNRCWQPAPLADGWELYRDSNGWQLRGTGASATVNGRPYQSGQVLDCGDLIAIGTATAGTLIEVSG